jgi:hypothetical protein
MNIGQCGGHNVTFTGAYRQVKQEAGIVTPIELGRGHGGG